MKRWYSLSEVPAGWGPSAVTIGKFDGVHLGHREILRQLRELADSRGLASTLITFDRHPAEVTAPDAAPLEILSDAERLDLIAQQGVTAALVLPFDQELAAVSPREFVTEILLGTLNAKAVLVGHDFRFGANAQGTVELLTELGHELGFNVVLIEDVKEDGHGRISSSHIRELISAGEVAQATELLGSYPRVSGEVVHGHKRGRELGFPTANIGHDARIVIPGDGVYAGWFVDEGKRYPAAISVGTNPTFEGNLSRTVEAYLLDENLDLYGHMATVEFVARIRGMVAFNGVEELVKQMHDDVRITRELVGSGKQ
ncbi:bifunctional riboflavin kinase/FAD synthetase [Aurantimicrobium minutum]|uniref:bifunctional riboflavin kinase/FAD synthetase n=1 Tax=Aurantimicrobium minutum TaxID=708131 RepID=UPI002472EE10|nr:bifunctional riboflavin kinase/FAD synthetase [Aurantimicrobium minutum]MDH6239675.1 riboflavin kinase/FMN adenylyltransferase [Aurantimicrobium minutum]